MLREAGTKKRAIDFRVFRIARNRLYRPEWLGIAVNQEQDVNSVQIFCGTQRTMMEIILFISLKLARVANMCAELRIKSTTEIW